MRYRGGGVGHIATRQRNEALLAEKHTLLTEVDTDEIEPMESDGSGSGVDDRDDGDDDGEGEGEDEDEDEDEAIGNDPGYNGLSVNAEDDVDLIMAAGFALL